MHFFGIKQKIVNKLHLGNFFFLYLTLILDYSKHEKLQRTENMKS